ncbi:hypothetical protein O3M35_004826 [Rhynocoris fuscipes]|uniref:Uncharacterized protein n=1 Tax=Rhynocoris fuscipes TaxID=488301 RepID=A0AAW1DHP8_9HEMI
MDDEKSVRRSEDRLSLMETRSRYSRYSSNTTLDSIGKRSGRFIQVGRSAAQYNIYKKTVSNRNYQGLSRAKVICKLKTMPLQYYQRIKTKQFLRERAFKKPKKNYTKARDKLLDERKDEPTNVKPLDTNKSPIWDRIETLIFKAAAKKAGIGVDKYEIIKNSLVNKKFNFLDYEKILQLFSSRSLDDLFMKPNNGLFDQDKLAASCITYKYRPEPMKIMQLPTIYPENMSIKNLFPETPAEEFESKMEQSLIQHYLKNADTSIIHKNEAIRRNARAAVITYLVANKPLQICKQPFDIFMRDIPYPRLTRNLKKSVIPRWKSAWNQLPKLTLDTRGYKMVGKINSDAQTEWKFTDLAEHFYFYKKLNKDFRKDDLEATIEAEENDRVLFGKAKRWRSKNIIKYNPPNSKFVTISQIKQEVKKILKRQTKSTQTLLGKPYLTPLRVNSPFIREPKYMTALEVVHFGELIKEPRLSSENESKSVKKYKYSVGKLSPTEKVRAIQECHQRRRDIAKKRSLKKMNYKFKIPKKKYKPVFLSEASREELTERNSLEDETKLENYSCESEKVAMNDTAIKPKSAVVNVLHCFTQLSPVTTGKDMSETQSDLSDQTCLYKKPKRKSDEVISYLPNMAQESHDCSKNVNIQHGSEDESFEHPLTASSSFKISSLDSAPLKIVKSVSTHLKSSKIPFDQQDKDSKIALVNRFLQANKKYDVAEIKWPIITKFMRKVYKRDCFQHLTDTSKKKIIKTLENVVQRNQILKDQRFQPESRPSDETLNKKIANIMCKKDKKSPAVNYGKISELTPNVEDLNLDDKYDSIPDLAPHIKIVDRKKQSQIASRYKGGDVPPWRHVEFWEDGEKLNRKLIHHRKLFDSVKDYIMRALYIKTELERERPLGKLDMFTPSWIKSYPCDKEQSSQLEQEEKLIKSILKKFAKDDSWRKIVDDKDVEMIDQLINSLGNTDSKIEKSKLKRRREVKRKNITPKDLSLNKINSKDLLKVISPNASFTSVSRIIPKPISPTVRKNATSQENSVSFLKSLNFHKIIGPKGEKYNMKKNPEKRQKRYRKYYRNEKFL